MVAGFERYYQIPRCFRDEDFRADRQPEFTQLDMELSFVEEEDVISTCDPLIKAMLAVGGVDLELPIERMTYDEAMLRYGTDRPDRRLGMEIHELGHVFGASEFKVFSGAIADGGVVRGLRARDGEFPRSRMDTLTERAQELGAKGLVWAVVEPEGWRSPIAKFLSDDEMTRAGETLGAAEGDALFIVADQAEVAAQRARRACASSWRKARPRVTTWSGSPTSRCSAGARPRSAGTPLHHPFTSPAGDLDADPGSWRSRGYDVVFDGWEIGGGSIRINRPDIQQKVFDALGIDEDEARERFGFLLDALRYGAPPHGGIAFGLDRIVTLLAGEASIRDAIAFPKTGAGVDPLTGAPAPVDARQLRELGVKAGPAAGRGA